MGEIDYGEIQQVLDDLLGQNVDFQNMAEQGASGNSPISFQNLLKMAEGLFFRELMEQKELWVHILILAIAAAVLLHFADVFQNNDVIFTAHYFFSGKYGNNDKCAGCNERLYDGTGSGFFSCHDADILHQFCGNLL